MAIRINDNSSNFSGSANIAIGSFTGGLVGTVAGDSGSVINGAINRAMGNFTASLRDRAFPINGWGTYGGYQISNQSQNMDVEPYKSWNEEKDILIIQGLGWRSDTLMDDAANRFQIFKQAAPYSKLLYYMIASEPSQPTFVGGSVVGYNDEVYELINSSTRGDSSTWYLRNTSGSLVESRFNPVNFHRANCYCVQFQDTNSFGRTFPEQFLKEHYDQFAEDRASDQGGFHRLNDYVDGLFWDVVPPIPEHVYVDGSNGATRDNADYNQDGSADGREDETDGAGVEANYGGARMHRRGAVQWLPVFSSNFGPSKVLWRNGTEDGIRYDFELSDGDPLGDSEFTNQWYGSIHERIDNDLGTSPNGTGYDVDFNGYETAIKRTLRIRQCMVPAGGHPWGRTGRYLSLMHIVDMNNRTSVAAITQIDYEHARFYGGIAALCGATHAPYGHPQIPFPRIDEYIYDWGDVVDNAVVEEDRFPESMGTVDMGTAGAPVTLRAYDYESGGAKFHWQEFANCIWIVRGDPPSTGAGNFGTGAGVAVQLPNPGVGKVWKYPDFTTTYTHPRAGWQTKNQSPTINDGSAVDAGGTYGTITMTPWTARMLVRADA